MDLDELGSHVSDTGFFHFPWGHWNLGTWFGLQVTRYMVLELIAGGLMILVFTGLARRIQSGAAPKGRFWNCMEFLVVFVRDSIARLAMSHKEDADRFVPLLWTMFFFILICNLLGILPWAGSPTGSLSVTSVLALIIFCTNLWVGILKHGILGYLKGLVPHMELPRALSMILVPMIFFIEAFGLLVRHSVLAIRLLANMFGGHLAIAVIVSFIVAAGAADLFVPLKAGIGLGSIATAAGLTLLDLLVAFLQAYIFTFLSALFIGMSIHPH